VATAKTRINVEVTEADIERAHKNDSYKCVVAQAVARIVPDATHVDVDTQTIRFTRQETGERLIYLTPYAVQGYVIAFDAGEAIEPFSFQLRNPIPASRRAKTSAGRTAHRVAQKARRQAAQARSTQVSSSGDEDGVTESPEPREAAKAAYAEARATQKKAPTTASVRAGRKPPPRVFKKKRRVYGHRVLRINQEIQG
jgi:hypothetical protein